MTNIGIAFEILDKDTPAPVGWKKATGHPICDVKMGLTRKAWWLLDGHLQGRYEGSTHAGVLSREIVRIALTYESLNKLNVIAGNICNIYFQFPLTQKYFKVWGTEFGIENVGKNTLLRRALHGGKAAGRDLRNHLRDCMRHLGLKSSLADPDVLMREAVTAEGNEYWEHILLYTDGVLVITYTGEKTLRDGIGKYFQLNEESFSEPKIYLGGHSYLGNCQDAWAFGSSQ